MKINNGLHLLFLQNAPSEMLNSVLSMALSVIYKSPEPKSTLAVRSQWILTHCIRKTNILARRNLDISKSENNYFQLKPRRIRKSLAFH